MDVLRDVGASVVTDSGRPRGIAQGIAQAGSSTRGCHPEIASGASPAAGRSSATGRSRGWTTGHRHVTDLCFPCPPCPPHNGGMSRRVLEITPDLMLRAYRHGLFPMAETRHGDRLFWLDPSAAASCRSTASTCRAGSRAPCWPTVRGRRGPRLPRHHRRLRRHRARPRRHLDQPADRAFVRRIASASATRIRWSAGRTAHWSAASMAWRSAACSSARACSASSATPRRWRWCISSRACGSAASPCWIRSSSPPHLAQFGAEEIAARDLSQPSRRRTGGSRALAAAPGSTGAGTRDPRSDLTRRETIFSTTWEKFEHPPATQPAPPEPADAAPPSTDSA